jgi:hypothetical protein
MPLLRVKAGVEPGDKRVLAFLWGRGCKKEGELLKEGYFDAMQNRAHQVKSFCLQILHWISDRRLYSLEANGGESN